MPASTEPAALLSSLYRTDGSATFSQNGYSVIGSVNGPIEVLRRDELPEEAAVEIIVRPANGAGGTRERHLESLLQSTLRRIILVHNFPRTLIQITLQIISTPQSGFTGTKLVQPGSNLPILPALLQTATLALLSASIPLSVTLTSTFLVCSASSKSSKVIQNPQPDQVQAANSSHVLGFTSNGELLVVESEGTFTVEEWDEIFEAGKAICCDASSDSGTQMEVDELEGGSGDMQTFVKSALQAKLESDLYWKA